MYDAKNPSAFGGHSLCFSKSTATLERPSASNCGVKNSFRGDVMGRFLASVGLAVFAFSAIALFGQNAPSTASVPAQSAFSATGSSSLNNAIQPVSANDDDTPLDPASLVPDLPPLPHEKASLVGGTVEKLDRVRDELTVQPFGGGKMKISFDSRTSIYRGGSLVSTSDLHRGDRVYVDTILDGSTVFARNIHLKGATSAGESQGVVVSYRSDKGELLLRDALSPEPLKIHVSQQTQITQYGKPVSMGELTPGTLVAVQFGTQERGDLAREISVLATPGSHFTFAGRVIGLDLRLGVITIASSIDHKTYEIYIDPARVVVDSALQPGVEITAETRFDGSRYVARSLSVQTQQR
jgi:hypothetical protein